MIFWMVVFAVSVVVYFVIAAVVSVKGVADVRDLLQPSDRQVINDEGAQDV